MIVIAVLALLLLLAVMIVVGHGLWVLIARLFRGPAQASHPQEVRLDLLPRRCPMCRMLLPMGASECLNCAVHRAAMFAPAVAASGEAPAGENEWDITARHVRQLFQAGLIDSATFASLDAAIRSARTPVMPPPLAQLAPIRPATKVEPGEQEAMPLHRAAAVPPPLPPRWVEPAIAPRPIEARVPSAVEAPKRPVGQVFASFMERKNIRWGELVGGLLIVGCSIALVLSFWAQIQHHPLLKFSIFTAVTAALFALGLYSEHRWKLPTTSSGILLIATLLVPLNFLAFAAFSHGVPAGDPIALGGEAFAFVLFAVLAWFAARVIAPQWPAWLTVGVMGLSAGTLAVRYLSVDAALPASRVLLLAVLAVACYAATSIGALVQVRRGKPPDLAEANAALLSLAVLSFAAVFPLSLIVSRGAEGSLHRLATLIGLAGLPALAGGVLLRKRMSEPGFVWQRVAATFASVIGAAILLAAVTLAWPDPAGLLATSLIAFAALLTTSLVEGSVFWLAAAQAAAALAAAAGVLFLRARGAAASERSAAILAELVTWRIIAAAWAALSLTWALLRVAVRPARPAETSTSSEAGAVPATESTGSTGSTGSPQAGSPQASSREERSWQKLAQLPFTFDRLMSAMLLAVLAALALWTTCSGVRGELAPSGYAWQPDAIGSQIVLAVAGPLPWLVLFMLLAAHLANAAEGLRGKITRLAFAITWIACPLWAAGYSGRVGGAASAFRWAAAVWLVLAAGAVWWRWGAKRFTPSPGTPGEGGGEGKILSIAAEDPHPIPLPEYRARGLLEGTSRDLWVMTKEHREREKSGATEVYEASLANSIDILLLLLGVAPIAALSLLAAGAILAGNTAPLGPGAFHPVGASADYIVPLLAVVGFLVGQSLRYRSNAYAIASVSSVNLLVTIVYVVANAGSGAADASHIVRLIQLNIATAAAASLVWLLLWRLSSKRSDSALSPPGVLDAWAWTALAGNLLVIVPAAGELFLMPQGAWSFGASVGSIWGWLALAMSCVAAAVVTMVRRRTPLGVAGIAVPMIAALTGVTATAWDRGNWFSFHVWMGAQTAAAWAILALGWWLERREPAANETIQPPAVPHDAGRGIENSALPAAGTASIALDYHPPAPPPLPGAAWSMVKGTATCWAGVLGLLAVVLALRAGLGDPAAPWPSAAVIVFIGLLAAALAVWTPAPAALYAAAGLLNLAATLVYVVVRGRFGGLSALGLVEVNVATLALPAIAWLVLELQFFRRVLGARRPGWPVHQSAAVISVTVLGAAVGVCFVRALLGLPSAVPLLCDLTALAALAGLLIACLWDEPPVPALGLLYVLGLIACARWLEGLNLPCNRIAWAGGLVLAGYGLLTSTLYALRGAIRPLVVRLGLPVARTGALPWLELANFGLAAVVLGIAFWSDFVFDSTGLRLLPALAALTQAASLALLTGPRHRRGRRDIMQAAVLIGTASLLAVGWAFLAPAEDPQGLQHAALAAALMTAVAVPLGLAFAGRRAPDYGQINPILTTACLLSLAAALGLEGYAQASVGRVEMPPWSIAAAAAAAGACCVAAVVLSLRPWLSGSIAGESPVSSERRQAACVYVAEALLALFFAHIRLTLPFLFHGYLERYWPLIVMAIAFAGVGLGEALRRRGRMAFARPLQNTGAFLPLIPVLAFWIASSHVHYSLLLLLTAALYGSLAFLRRSTLCGLVAALAGNGSLWYLLSGSESLGFFAHPQVWVIPAALSGLMAAELNRARLSAAELRTARYLFVVTLYLSSTADIFINGAAHSTWLPLALAGLSVAGVLAGVALRVRPFLFLGTAFLTLSIIAMIYNAAASLQITWIWYVAGIVLGLFIILLFALFEKKRSAMLALVEGLKAWE